MKVGLTGSISLLRHPWSSINYLIELPKIVSSKTLDILEILNLEP